MQNIDSQRNTAQPPAEGQSKLTASQRNRARLQRLRESLGSIRHQVAFTIPQAAALHGHSATWGYRRVYCGDWRVTNQGGRLLVPRSELEHFLGGAREYNPPAKRNGGGGNAET